MARLSFSGCECFRDASIYRTIGTVSAYNLELERVKGEYVQKRSEFLIRQKAHNEAISAFRSRYKQGSAEAVERYLQMVLEKSEYPEPIAGEAEVRFDEVSKTAIVSFWLPNPEDVPKIVEFKFVASRKAINPVEMKQREFDAFYDDLIHQIALRTISESVRQTMQNVPKQSSSTVGFEG